MKRHILKFIFYFLMHPLVNIILRGISGVGKSFLRRMLVYALEKMGKRVHVISKDFMRLMVMDSVGSYKYTKEEEDDMSRRYRNEWLRVSADDSFDVVIVDNTNVKKTEFLTTLTCRGDPNRVVHNVVIQIGDALSNVPRKQGIPQSVIDRMRADMANSDSTVDEYLASGKINCLITCEPKTTIEQGVQGIIDEINDLF